MSLTKEQVEHIASLARLRLEESEFGDVVDKLSRIVDFVDQLQAAPTEDVLPMAHPLDMSQRLRADDITETDQAEAFPGQFGSHEFFARPGSLTELAVGLWDLA